MQVSGAISDVLVAIPSSTCYRSYEFRNHFHPFSDSKYSFLHPSANSNKSSSFYIGKLTTVSDKCTSRGFLVRASENSGNSSAPIAPVHLESPVGQMLIQILQTHPHLVPATIEEQLETLKSDRDGSPVSSDQELLYRRIAEVREKERQIALLDIIYCCIVHRFVENNISMIPKIVPSSDPTGRVDYWPNQEQKLESVHSPEAFEMVKSHLDLVLGEGLVAPLQTLVDISKLKVGKLYAASIMYGYFLRRVDQRYQLERTMKTLPEDFGKNVNRLQFQSPLWDPDSLIQIPADADEARFEPVDFGDGESYKLRSYVMYLDNDTLESYATIRSKESLLLIERQTQALFGRPDFRIAEGGVFELASDENISITFTGLTGVILKQ
ncbi:hypothetical protein RDABS01_026287 [Bienertia sinuspersici]